MYTLEKNQHVSIYRNNKKLNGYKRIIEAASDIKSDIILNGFIYNDQFLIDHIVSINQQLCAEKDKSNFLKFLSDQYNWHDGNNDICLIDAFVQCPRCKKIPPCECEKTNIVLDIPLDYLSHETQLHIAENCNAFDSNLIIELLGCGKEEVRRKIYTNINNQVIINRGFSLLKGQKDVISVVSAILVNPNTPSPTLESFALWAPKYCDYQECLPYMRAIAEHPRCRKEFSDYLWEEYKKCLEHRYNRFSL